MTNESYFYGAHGIDIEKAKQERIIGHCADLIDRQAAIEKIHWLDLDHDTAIKCDLAIRALPSVIPSRPTEPCEDAISRQAALDIVDSYTESQSNVEDVTQDIISEIVILPSVNPQEPSDISNDGTLTVNVEDGRKISRVLVCGANHWGGLYYPDEQEPKTGHCKDCKYFEYDSPTIVDGIPLIVAHEICSKWGRGCKTCEDGYCFMFEQRMESEGVE